MKRLHLKKQKKNTKYILKKAAVAAVGTVTAASLLVGGLFASPKDITAPFPETPPAIVQVLEPDIPADEEDTAPEKRKSLKERMREKLLSWPPWLRAVLLVPMWGFGTLAGILLRRILPRFLRWLLGAFFPILLLLAGLKLLFPDVPLKKLLCKRNRIALGVLAVLLLLTGPVIGHFRPDWWEKAWLVFAVKLGLLAITFAVACVQILAKRRAAASVPAEIK